MSVASPMHVCNVAALLLLLLLQPTTSASSLRSLESYPHHLQCSACLSFAEYIGDRMNQTARIKSSVKKSGRLEEGTQRYVDYESSELRGIEILETACSEYSVKYTLRVGADDIRLFSADTTLVAAPVYDDSDDDEEAYLGSELELRPKMAFFCSEIIEKFEQELIELIRNERLLDRLQQRLCLSRDVFCLDESARAKSIAAEKELRRAWLARFERRKRRAEKKDARQHLKPLDRIAVVMSAAGSALAGICVGFVMCRAAQLAFRFPRSSEHFNGVVGTALLILCAVGYVLGADEASQLHVFLYTCVAEFFSLLLLPVIV